MTASRLLPLFVLALGVALPPAWAGSSSGAADKAVAPSIAEESWGGSLLGIGGKTNGNFTEGAVFLTQPLWNTMGRGGRMGGSLLFIEPYATWGDGGAAGGTLGVGFRHLFSEQTVQDARSNANPGLWKEGFYVGGNFFVDYDHTRAGSDFWQVGTGLEAGTRYFQVRGNYYIPESDAHTLSRSTDISSRTYTRHYSQTRVGPPYTAANGSTVQDVTRTNYTESRTVTTRTVREVFEEPMEGWDVELALTVPYIERWCDTHLIGGYYHYQGDRSHDQNFGGWRAGVEMRPLRGLVLSATWYEKNQLYREHWLVGARLEIPLGKPGVAVSSGRRHLADYLMEPVRRKNSAVTTSAQQSETTSTSSSTSTTTTTTGSSTSQNVVTPPPAPPQSPGGEKPPPT